MNISEIKKSTLSDDKKFLVPSGMNVLLIAEKPSLMRTIRDVYNKHKSEIPMDISFVAQAGHLYRLLSPKEMDEKQAHWAWENLPIDPDAMGGFKYGVIDRTKDIVKTIKEELNSGEYEAIINAGDPDQEGELLIRETLEMLHNKLPVYRFWTNDLTEPKVLAALKNLKDDDHDPMCVNMLSAARARQHSDYRVGMNGSEAASLKVNGTVIVGRVRSAILSMVCQREEEILNFVPKTTYGIKAIYSEGFEGSYSESGEDKYKGVYFDTKDEANAFMTGLSGPAVVKSYNTKQEKKYAPKLYKLATLQGAAGKFGYTSNHTLEIAQSLYEQKVLSYPRTDCEYISSGEDLKGMLKSAAADPEMKPFIDRITDSDIARVLKDSRYVNDKALTKSGHSAMVPTTSAPTWSSLNVEQKNIFHLIAMQFVSVFFPPLVQDKAELVTEISGHAFVSSGKTLVDKGYTEVTGTNVEDSAITPHKVGDTIDVKNFSLDEKTSTCPKRFTDASLALACENPAKWLEDDSLKSLGKELTLGTPATRGSIIESLVVRDKYLESGKNGVLTPTTAGMSIYKAFKNLECFRVDMTGQWEEKLQQIRAGSYTFEEMEEGMRQYVIHLIDEIKALNVTSLEGISRGHAKSLGECPKCHGDMLSGKTGFYCSNYKNGCTFSTYKKIFETPISDSEYSKMLGAKRINKKVSWKGKEWTAEFELDMETGRVNMIKNEPKTIDAECPKCHKKQLVDFGKGIKCECGFILWKTMKINGHEKKLSDKVIKDLLEDKVTESVSGFTSKKGNKFSAKLKLSDAKDGHIEFVFN